RAGGEGWPSPLALDREVIHVERGVWRRGVTDGRVSFGASGLKALADHQLDEAPLIHLGALERAHTPAGPHDRDAIAVGEDLADLVGDEHDGEALIGHGPGGPGERGRLRR